MKQVLSIRVLEIFKSASTLHFTISLIALVRGICSCVRLLHRKLSLIYVTVDLHPYIFCALC